MSYIELKFTHPKGKKDYTCVWCDESIPKGEQHVYRVYLYNGFQHDRFHTECAKAMRQIDWDDGNDFYPGQFKRGTEELR